MSNQAQLDHIALTKTMVSDMIRNRMEQFNDLFNDGFVSALQREEMELCQMKCRDMIEEQYAPDRVDSRNYMPVSSTKHGMSEGRAA